MIKTGNISNVSSKYKDWFLGAFIEEEWFNTGDSKKFEIKWSKRAKGYIHHPKDKLVENNSSRSLIICIYGEFLYRVFADNDTCTEYSLKNEGDYIFFTPEVLHEVEVLEESLIITIRWYK